MRDDGTVQQYLSKSANSAASLRASSSIAAL